MTELWLWWHQKIHNGMTTFRDRWLTNREGVEIETTQITRYECACGSKRAA